MSNFLEHLASCRDGDSMNARPALARPSFVTGSGIPEVNRVIPLDVFVVAVKFVEYWNRFFSSPKLADLVSHRERGSAAYVEGIDRVKLRIVVRYRDAVASWIVICLYLRNNNLARVLAPYVPIQHEVLTAELLEIVPEFKSYFLFGLVFVACQLSGRSLARGSSSTTKT